MNSDTLTANSVTALTSSCRSSTVLLATAVVVVSSQSGATTHARTLIDPGAEVSFVSESLVQRLKLRRSSVAVPIIGVDNCKMMTKSSTTLTVSSRIDPTCSYTIEAHILQKFTSYTPKCVKSVQLWSHFKDLVLADPDFASNTPMELIIGVDLFSLIVQEEIARGPVGTPLGRRTTLGWILVKLLILAYALLKSPQLVTITRLTSS